MAKWTNTRLKNTTHKTKDRTILKIGDERMYTGKVSGS